MSLLVKLPRERWAERNEHNHALLHFAYFGPNVEAAVALLRSGLVDVNARNTWGGTAVHSAAIWELPRMVEVLCAAGADLQARDKDGDTPINVTLRFAKQDGGEPVRVLVANGVRLSTVREEYRFHITPELVAFERGVLRCRAAVVAMLRVKRAGQLVRWDKFLLVELALCIWSTRYDKGWQTATKEDLHAMLLLL